MLDGDDVICIAATMAGQMISSTLQPGTRVPAYCTANGRVLVASLSKEEGEAWVARQNLRPLTQRTMTDKQRLLDELTTVRLQGWCIVDRELEDNLLTLSVPLRNHPGETVAAMNLSVEASRISAGELHARGLPRLLKAQATLRGLL